MGKTCLAKLFVEEKVVRNVEHTIGLDYFIKDVKLKNGTLTKVSLYILFTFTHFPRRGYLTSGALRLVTGEQVISTTCMCRQNILAAPYPSRPLTKQPN